MQCLYCCINESSPAMTWLPHSCSSTSQCYRWCRQLHTRQVRVGVNISPSSVAKNLSAFVWPCGQRRSCKLRNGEFEARRDA